MEAAQRVLHDMIVSACAPDGRSVPLDALRSILDEHGLQAIVQTVERDVHRTGSGTRRICKELHAQLLEVVTRARARDTVKPLYDMYAQLLSAYLAAAAATVQANFHGVLLLEEVGRRWQTHRLVTKWFTPVYRGVDPGYSAQYLHKQAFLWQEPFFATEDDAKVWRAANVPPYLTSVSMRAFRTHFFDAVKSGIMDTIQQLADGDRRGELVDRDTLRQATQMMLVMGICQQPGMGHMRDAAAVEAAIIANGAKSNPEYVADFEDPFVARTLEFYGVLCTEWLAAPVSAYMRNVSEALEKEDARCRAYVYAFTRTRVLRECRTLLLEDRVRDIVGNADSGMLAMLRASFCLEEAVDAPSKAKEVRVGMPCRACAWGVCTRCCLPMRRTWRSCFTCSRAAARRASPPWTRAFTP
jgi:hypothetical protein